MNGSFSFLNLNTIAGLKCFSVEGGSETESTVDSECGRSDILATNSSDSFFTYKPRYIMCLIICVFYSSPVYPVMLLSLWQIFLHSPDSLSALLPALPVLYLDVCPKHRLLHHYKPPIQCFSTFFKWSCFMQTRRLKFLESYHIMLCLVVTCYLL